MNEPVLIISYDELKILLYNRGFRSCSGILMPEKEYTQEEILQIMNRLALRGLIEAKEEHFVIPPQVAQTADLIGAPQSSYSFSDPETGQVYCCYISDTLVVVTEKNWARKDTLRIRRFTPQEFSDWRNEIGV